MDQGLRHGAKHHHPKPEFAQTGDAGLHMHDHAALCHPGLEAFRTQVQRREPSQDVAH